MEQTNNNSVFARLFSGTAVILLLILTAALLLAFILIGAPSARQTAAAPIQAGEQFYQRTAEAISQAMPSLGNVQKSYRITGTIPPKPSRSGYGQAAAPAEMVSVIAASEPLLNGQTLYFSSVTDYHQDYGIHYYQDPSILAITWKQTIQNTMYTFSEIKLADASQFRRYLSGGEYGSGKLYYTTDMASTVHAVVAISGDYFENRHQGVIVYNGNVCRVGTNLDTCYIDKNGDMKFTRIREKMNTEIAGQFVDSNEIQFSLAFGPVLVENGVQNKFRSYPLGEVEALFPRAALCQMDELHYLLITANLEGDARAGTTMFAFSDVVYSTGCKNAYALDGGQTAALVMDNVLVNRVYMGYQRKISDIIYFATAVQ